MHGHVWEWIEDCYHDAYRGAPTEGSARVRCGGSEERVLRGGGTTSLVLHSASPPRAFAVDSLRLRRVPSCPGCLPLILVPLLLCPAVPGARAATGRPLITSYW
jgi:hypothetical protein